mgnify:CR=1 FL=1
MSAYYYVKLVGNDYKLSCVVKKHDNNTYINQYGGIYQYVEKNNKKYLVSGDDVLEIVVKRKLQGAIVLEPSKINTDY